MLKVKGLLNCLVIIPVMLLTSCGYLTDKPVENIDVYKTDELQSCKIDVSKISDIFTADQKEQIRCLQENFVQFTKYVRSKHAGAITEAELGIFVKRFFEGQSDAIIKGLSLIFQLNMILLKDEADRISNSKITPLFELLVSVNQEAVILTNIIKSMDEESNQQKFWDLKERFNQSITRFSTSTVAIIQNSPGISKRLNIRSFVSEMSKKIGDQEIDNKTIDSFIFMKKLLVAGDAEIITTDELRNVISKLPQLLGLVFDVYYVKGENFNRKSDEMRFYLTSINVAYKSIQFDQPDFELLNSDQLVEIAKKVLTDYDVGSFKGSIEALKSRFIGGKRDSVTLNDLKTTLNMVNDFFEKVYFNYVTYQDPVNSYILNQSRPVLAKELPLKSLPGYDLFPDKVRLKELHDSFLDTATFRYFRESTGTAIYDTKISRNINGFNESNILKWVSHKLLNAYGHKDSKNQIQISMDEFSVFLLDSKPILEEFKLWSPNFTTFSRNAVLLADLFQQQSNGDQNINVNESTEYLGMLLTAVDVSGKFSDQLTRLCDGGINDLDPIFELTCYNEFFYDTILNKLSYRESFPRLANYFERVSKKESLDYLIGVEGFARDSNAPGVPVNHRDSTLIIGAMINIETTFIRFDTNLDNIIDYHELLVAFETYRASIIALAGLKPEQEKYAKGIFLYMASRMEIPQTGTWMQDLKFAAFDTCVSKDWCRERLMDKVEAKRLNIGKLLYYLVNQATPSAPTVTKIYRPKAATTME